MKHPRGRAHVTQVGPSNSAWSAAILLALGACSPAPPASSGTPDSAAGAAGQQNAIGGQASGGLQGSGGDQSSGGASAGQSGGNGGVGAGAGGDSADGGSTENSGGSKNGGAAGKGATGNAGSAGGGGAGGLASGASGYDAIYSGSPWFDDQGNVVNAHAAGIIQDGGKYYLFGEAHSDTSNAFTAFNCYSSTDLSNWKFENQVLTVQTSGILGPNRVGERAKVMKCPSSGEYVMFMHTDNLTYTNEAVGYATSPTINGEYTFKGALQYSGGSIARWDMGTFQDTNGNGYILANGGDVYQLASDYHSATSQVVTGIATGGESPALFKAGSSYFFLFSARTSWERNDNTYYTASSVSGPWTSRGKFAPSGKLTWNSQTTFVLPISGSSGTTYLFLGDRWSYPRQGSAATYVWQPLTVSGTSLSMPSFSEAWRVDPSRGTWSAVTATGTAIDDNASGTGLNQFRYTGNWTHGTGGGYNNTESRSASAGDTVAIQFTGAQLKLYGVAAKDEGYATFTLTGSSGATVASGTLDFYSNYRDTTNELKYASPVLPSGTYTFKLTVAGAHSTWSDKAGTVFGSTGDYVSIDRALVLGGT